MSFTRTLFIVMDVGDTAFSAQEISAEFFVEIFNSCLFDFICCTTSVGTYKKKNHTHGTRNELSVLLFHWYLTLQM